MYPFYLELELFKPVSDYFKNQGYVVKKEVRIGFCKADIVAFKGDLVTAVELKLQNWKRAIIQAKNYQLGSDYVYIAFPLMKSYSILRKAEFNLKSNGIGFLIVNEKTSKVCEIIEARKSNKKIGTLTLDRVNKMHYKRKRLF
jgi:hypothetical protein